MTVITFATPSIPPSIASTSCHRASVRLTEAPVRQADLDEERALVLARQEAGRHDAEQPAGCADRNREQQRGRGSRRRAMCAGDVHIAVAVRSMPREIQPSMPRFGP